MLLPIAPIEFRRQHRAKIFGVEAAKIHAVAIGMRTWHVEGLDAAGAAEQMFGGTRVENIGRDFLLAGKQTKPRFRHDEMQIACHSADGTITGLDLHLVGSLYLKAHGTAVTAAFFPACTVAIFLHCNYSR